MKQLIYFAAILLFISSCKKEPVHKDYNDISSATVNGSNWTGDADVIHKTNILGENIWVKSFSFFNVTEKTVLEIELIEAVYVSKGASFDQSKAKFVYRKSVDIPFYYSTEYNLFDTYGRIEITDYDESYGIEGIFEFIAYKTDSTKVIVSSGAFSAKDN